LQSQKLEFPDPHRNPEKITRTTQDATRGDYPSNDKLYRRAWETHQRVLGRFRRGRCPYHFIRPGNARNTVSKPRSRPPTSIFVKH